MKKIHINSFLGNEFPLETNTLPEEFDSCAAKYENMAREYRKMSKYLRDKQINVVEASGHAYCGTFSVDDIDTARLTASGYVVDVDDNPTAQNPLFSIDPEFDRMLNDMDSKPLWKDIIEDREEDSEEIPSDTYDLANLLTKETPEFESNVGPGAINLEVTQIAEDHYLFKLDIQDLGDDPTSVAFSRKTGEFHYNLGSCSNRHTQTIDAVYRSLVTASALLSNFVYMVRGSQEFGMAIRAIDEDLRLLQHLIAFDYGVDRSNK